MTSPHFLTGKYIIDSIRGPHFPATSMLDDHRSGLFFHPPTWMLHHFHHFQKGNTKRPWDVSPCGPSTSYKWDEITPGVKKTLFRASITPCRSHETPIPRETRGTQKTTCSPVRPERPPTLTRVVVEPPV